MPEQKHIVFVSSWYPNRNNPTHGIFNKYFAQAASLYDKVTVLNVSAERGLKQSVELNVTQEGKVITVQAYYRKFEIGLPLLAPLIKRQRVLAAFDAAYDLLLQEAGKPDLFQLNVVMPMGVGVLHLATKYHIPYVINENWSGYCEEDGNYKGLLQKYFTRKIIAGAKCIMPTSSFLQEAMQKHGLNGTYRVVPNVVDVNVFKPQDATENDVTHLIHISSLNDREKNVSGIIRAFHKASIQSKKLNLTIVGEGVDSEQYKKMVTDLGLGNKVTFTGRLLSKDLVHQINMADALIMFSNYETFCLVIIEAFACGKPVITSDAGAIKTYMLPELGIMVPKNNEEELEGAILRFDKNKTKFDHQHIRDFAVNNYSYEKVGETLHNIYISALLQEANSN